MVIFICCFVFLFSLLDFYGDNYELTIVQILQNYYFWEKTVVYIIVCFICASVLIVFLRILRRIILPKRGCGD